MNSRFIVVKNHLPMKNKIKSKNIAFICSSLDMMAGGIERQIIRTCEALILKKYNVILITYDNEKAKSFYKIPKNLSWYKCGLSLSPNKSAPLFKRLNQIYEVRKILNKFKITHLVTFHHGLLPRSILAASFLNIKQIVSERNSLNHYNFIKLNKLNIGFISMFLANNITVQLKSYKNQYPKLLQKKISIIPNFIEKPIDDKFSPAFNSNVIAMVGRLTYQKNFQLLLSQATLHHENKNFKIKIAGEGELRSYFQTTFKKLIKKSCLELNGNVENVDNFLLNSSVLCFPSLWEGYPNILIEALRVGLPIVTTKRMIELKEFVEHSVNGLIVDDSQLFLSTIKLMGDKDLLLKMGKESKKKFLKLYKDKPVMKWEKLF